MKEEENGLVVVCPTCGERWECQTQVGLEAKEGAKPSRDSLLICIACGEIMVFDAEMTARRLTEEEARNLPAETVELLAKAEYARQRTCEKFNRPLFADKKP